VNLARALFENPYQKCTSINQAVTYLNKAVSINPENAELQSMLEDANLYQSGLQSFVDGNWQEAIEYFHTLSDQNPEFAHQNLQALHYEAYDALARQLNNEKRYSEAFDLLLMAEDLANQDSENLMKIFQIQVLLGETLGEMADYQRAVSYYQTAIRILQPHIDLNNIPLASQKVQEASQHSLEEDYQNAFFALEEAISEIRANLSKHEMIIEEGICLALVASENNSTVNAIIEVNNLTEIRITQENQPLTIPTIR
jgi:tetratricopeptide (TPR) repeat protein